MLYMFSLFYHIIYTYKPTLAPFFFTLQPRPDPRGRQRRPLVVARGRDGPIPRLHVGSLPIALVDLPGPHDLLLVARPGLELVPLDGGVGLCTEICV
jgi:hypothetical protein